MNADAEKIFLDNMNLAHHIANKFYMQAKRMNIDPDDVKQEAMIGLIKAANGFDPSLGWRFSTYAGHKITGEIVRFFRDRATMIRIPRGLHAKASKEGTLSELVQMSHLESITYKGGSDADKGITIMDMIGDDADFSEIIVEEFIDSLNERNRVVATLVMNDYSQAEVGAFIGVSQAQASRDVKKLRVACRQYFGVKEA